MAGVEMIMISIRRAGNVYESSTNIFSSLLKIAKLKALKNSQ